MISAWLALRVVALALWALVIAQSDVSFLRQGALVAESLAATALLIAFLLPAWRARRFRLTVPSTELT
jgi:hypothetical protein